MTICSGLAMGLWGQISPIFYQDDARDFFKTDENFSGEGEVVADLQRSRGPGQKFSSMLLTFLSLTTLVIVCHCLLALISFHSTTV